MGLILRKERMDRLDERGWGEIEWALLTKDLVHLKATSLEQHGKCLILRDEARGLAGKAFQAAGVAIPPRIRQMDSPA